jgi:hypothetical protein
LPEDTADDHLDVSAVRTGSLQVASPPGAGSPGPVRTLPVADLHVATVDPMGRLWVRLTARLLGWVPGQTVTIAVRDGVTHMSGEATGATGIPVTLDDRHLVQVPFGLRAMVGFHPGIRVLVITIPTQGSVAMLPVHRVVTAFGIE